MKKVICIILAVLVGWWGYEKAVDNFHVRYIRLQEWPEVLIAKKASSEGLLRVSSVLDQPFYYLDKGRQFYAFISRDGKYVLKFIKCQRFNEFEFCTKIPFLKEMRKDRVKEKQARLTSLFQSCFLSLDLLPDLTGVIFTHLINEPEVRKKVTLIDRIGFHHVIDIDTVPFVLQYRAQKVISTFQSLYQQKSISEIHVRIDQLIHLFLNRAKRFVIDIDDGIFLRDNIGFLEDRAVFIDIGTFVRSEQSMTKERLAEDFDKLSPLATWLKAQDPALAEYFFNGIKNASN